MRFAVLLLVLALTVVQAQSKCKKYVDIAIVAEMPTKNTARSVDLFMAFLNHLKENFRDTVCYRYSVTLAGNQIAELRSLSCILSRCDWSMLMQANAFKSAPWKKGPVKRLLVDAVAQATKELLSRGRSFAEKRLILIPSLSPNPEKKTELFDAIKGFHEERKLKVIVLAIGAGREERLNHLADETNRVLQTPSFSSLAEEVELAGTIGKLVFDPKDRSHIPVVGFSAFGGGLPSVGALGEQVELAELVAEDEKCEYIVDIGFLVDSSGSLKWDYRKELHFVQRIANRFVITEHGTHAGLIVFSDDGGYVKVHIKMNEFLDTKSFNDAVAKTPYFGYRTRIDLAFDLAYKELLTPAGGARPNMKKIIFLITDGRQNPVVDGKGFPLDPVAASQLLYDDGVVIFAVGIGSTVNVTQLNKIARSPNRVYLASDIDELISDEFVKSVSKKLCQGGNLQVNETVVETNCTKAPQTECNSCCCGGRNVYINIFQAGSGSSYVMQGAQITQHGNTADTLTANAFPPPKPKVNIGSGSSVTTEDLLKVIKESLPQHEEFTNALKKLLEKTLSGQGSKPGKNVISKRKRRSVDESDVPPQRLPRFSEMLKVAKLSGCNLFITALERFGITDEINTYIRNNKTVTLFCPVDQALDLHELYPADSLKKAQIRELLRHHVAVKHDTYGTMYKSMAKYGHIVLHPTHSVKLAKTTWMVEDAHIKFSLYDGKHGEIVIIDQMLEQPLLSLKRAIKLHPNLTKLNGLLKKVKDMDDLLRPEKIEKVCFGEHLCVGLSDEMKLRIKEALKFKQISMIAPSDQVFKRMKNWEILSLYTNKKKLREFLRQHIFLGIICKKGCVTEEKMIAQPIDGQNPVSILHEHNGARLRADHSNKLFKLADSVRVKEGMLIVEDVA